MKKIRVLQFSIASKMGGRTRYIIENWRWIDKNKFEFDFVTFDNNLPIEKELEEQGCHVFHITCRPEVNKSLRKESKMVQTKKQCSAFR